MINSCAVQTPVQMKFNDEFYNKIVCRDKTQTTRTTLKQGIHLGKLFEAVFKFEENNLPLIPTKITIKRFIDLNKKDAKREGYLSETNFKLDLMKIYPDLKLDSVVYCIQFYLHEKWHDDDLDYLLG